MLLVGSSNAQVGFEAGMQVLRDGGNAIDAVEATIRLVESNPEDHSVGYSGLPNVLGEVELDASIMNGHTLASGAVCAVHNYEHVISVAKEVMLRLPHVMLAGPGAERFAKEIGMKKRNLLTPESEAIYKGKAGREANQRYNLLRDLVNKATKDPQIAASLKDYHDEVFGTVNVIAIDKHGDIASGVSTSGWAWKYPGRVGDSPIIGAGNYADNRYGACACTGYGEMAIRGATAHSVVLYMKTGKSLVAAGREAMKDLRRLTVPFPPGMNLVAIDAQGKHTAMTTETDRAVTYIYQTEKMPEPALKPRIVIPLTKKQQSAG
ncbi:MAG: N(4)-(beta-N-acetylglucosaminyl)-L-asparaginase [Chloroflexi bacterium]|nr:N(4)-(beta-N-acetylglucosaminyl)-L-asparaginase [Chloroflexota bacterium]